MKLLINLCSHDGIVSHYNGVGTMTMRYIYSICKVLESKNIEYKLNLFTPVYNNDSGFNEKVYKKHLLMNNVKIYMIDNGSNGKINYGKLENWKLLCENTANELNNIDYNDYDTSLIICNDTPFAGLPSLIKKTNNVYKSLILHSTVKIHKIDSAIENSNLFYNQRLSWEKQAIEFINKDNYSYYGYVGNFIFKHLINEYGLKKEKGVKIFNGEIIDDIIINDYSQTSKELFKEIKNHKEILLSFGRAEEYKNLCRTFELGKVMNIKSIVIAQLYYKEQPIKKEYEESARDNNGILYLNPPFDFAKYILNNYNNKMICLIPSKKEIMGLIINEVRNINNNNMLLVANNVDGLREQISDGFDGVLVDLDDIHSSAKKIESYFNIEKMQFLNKNGKTTIKKKYDIIKNVEIFLDFFIKRG